MVRKSFQKKQAWKVLRQGSPKNNEKLNLVTF